MKGILLTILRELRGKEASKTNSKAQSQLEEQPHPGCMWPGDPMIAEDTFPVKLKLDRNCALPWSTETLSLNSCPSEFLFWHRCYVCDMIKLLVPSHEAILEGHLLYTPEG